VKYTAPIPFREALDALQVKSVLPTTGGTAEISSLPLDVLEHAMVSARVNNAQYLKQVADVLDRMHNAQASGRPLNKAYAMQTLRDALRKLGYRPGAAGVEPGSLQDFSSDARLNILIDTNLDQAAGYGNHIAAQTPVLLDAYPCQELYRQRLSADRRPWGQIWADAGGRTYGGRMIAKKDDSVWVNISDFGRPYPPYKWGSGMWSRDVSRKEALALGVVGLDTPVTPDRDRGFARELKLSPDQRHADLYQRLRNDLSDIASVSSSGTLTFNRSKV